MDKMESNDGRVGSDDEENNEDNKRKLLLPSSDNDNKQKSLPSSYIVVSMTWFNQILYSNP